MSNIAPVNQKPLTPSSIPQPTGEISSPPAPVKKIERKDLSKKKIKWNYIIGVIILLMLVIGGGAGYWLTQQSQDIRQQASEVYPTPSPVVSPTPKTCNEQCPGPDGILYSCTPPESDGTSEDSICNSAGRVESCGGTEYCCPEPGGNWTTNMTACEIIASPTPSPSVSPSPSPSTSPDPSVSPSPSPSTSPDPSVSPSPSTEITYACNSNCSSNSQCQGTSSDYICWLGQCRLDSNPTSDQCTSSTSTATQPDLPAELPEAGSEDVLNWLKAGFGVLGIGTVLLLLL